MHRRVRVALIACCLTGLVACDGGFSGGTIQVRSAPTPLHPALRETLVRSLGIDPASGIPEGYVRWRGPVEHLFFHTLVVRPDLAFARTTPGAQGLRDYMVTATEFRRILDQLWKNGWTLVDLHRATTGQVYLPRGRKPFVLSEDDVNYYDYSRPYGLAWRLVLTTEGRIRAEVRDDRGTRLTDDDVIPIVDAFIAEHPEFSAQGAKGVLGLTGYEGLLGERLAPGDTAGRQRAVALAHAIAADGWSFANHTWGHIDLSRANLAWVQDDLARWRKLAEPIVGATDVLIYPFGARPPTVTAQWLAAAGYTIQLDIDTVPRLIAMPGYTLMSRRHIDGIALRDAGSALSALFSTTEVRDGAARAT